MHRGENMKEFETDRLVLRKFTIDDAEDMFNNYAKNENVTKYLFWKPHQSIQDSKDYLTNIVMPDYKKETTLRWAIELKETGKVIGCIDVVSRDETNKRAELGWVLGEEYWGKGIMPEAGKVVVDYLFSLGFIRIQAKHFVGNKKSGRVMQKLGMTHECTLKKFAFDNQGNFVDCEMYAIVK